MAAGDGAQLPATVAASRSVEKALEEAAASGALNLANRKLKEFPRSARNYDLSDITHAGRFASHCFPQLRKQYERASCYNENSLLFYRHLLLSEKAHPLSTRFTRLQLFCPDDCHNRIPRKL